MEDDFFSPGEMTVPLNSAVVWRNAGQNRHSTVSPGIWNSSSLRAGQTWGANFITPGTFEYYCAVHPSTMRGKLTVSE
jgi:plastocyanin